MPGCFSARAVARSCHGSASANFFSDNAVHPAVPVVVHEREAHEFHDVPEILIDLVDRPREPPLGAGGAAATPVPAALANAVFDAAGIRLRTVPFTRQRVLAALA